MSKRNSILATSLVWAVVLAGVLVYFLHRPHTAPKPEAAEPAPLAMGPSAAPDAVPKAAGDSSPQPMTAPLVPVQPTDDQMQSAGVRTGKPVQLTDDQMQSTGVRTGKPVQLTDDRMQSTGVRTGKPVQLTDDQMQSIGVRTGKVEYSQLDDEVRATGTVAVDDRLTSSVQVRFAGYIRTVFANATYQYVHKGQPLFTIYSPDLVATEQEYLLAKQDEKALGGSTVGDVAADASSLSTAAEQRLAQWEIPAREIAKLTSSGTASRDLTIDSPASGYITAYNALPNMYAQPGAQLYTLAGLSEVWVNAQLFQTDVGRVKPGDRAEITVDAYPQKTFRGRIEQILPQVDMATRTVSVRLSIENPHLLLKPGMFVNVDLKSSMGRRLVVPASAVFQTGLKQVVFVNSGEGRLQPVEVTLGPQVGDRYVVLSGLKAGEPIVTSANFLIDSEAQLQAASGSYTPPPPGAGTDQGEQAQIEFATDPNPPRKGSNLFHVKLTGKNGAPVAGAQVGVVFYMPAMASMGMAAMKTTASLSDKGGGVYEGSGSLGSGGAWQVTVTATRAGQEIASKQLRLIAGGGM